MNYNKPSRDLINLNDGMLSEFQLEHIDYTELHNYFGTPLNFYQFLIDKNVDTGKTNVFESDKLKDSMKEFEQILEEREKKLSTSKNIQNMLSELGGLVAKYTQQYKKHTIIPIEQYLIEFENEYEKLLSTYNFYSELIDILDNIFAQHFKNLYKSLRCKEITDSYSKSIKYIIKDLLFIDNKDYYLHHKS